MSDSNKELIGFMGDVIDLLDMVVEYACVDDEIGLIPCNIEKRRDDLLKKYKWFIEDLEEGETK